jgi:hypothetical protein
VLLGNGDGTFHNSTRYSATIIGRSVAVVDFYGDGIPALAVTGEEGTTVFRGNGDGTFQNSGVGYVTTGYSQAVVAGDFHGDGLPDLAISNTSLGVPGLVDDVVILGNEGRGASDPLTPRSARSQGAHSRWWIQNTASTFTGSVRFSSSDQGAMLPTNYHFVAADGGMTTFTITLQTADAQQLEVDTAGTPDWQRSATMQVDSPPVPRRPTAAVADVFFSQADLADLGSPSPLLGRKSNRVTGRN